MDLKVIEYFDDRTNSTEESLCYLESKIKDQNLLTKNFCQFFSMYKGNCTALITITMLIISEGRLPHFDVQ